MIIDLNKHIQRPRTEEELRKALHDFIYRKHRMCIPVQVDDSDIVLSDGIKELVDARKHIADLTELAERANKLLTDLAHPFATVERYHVNQWLEDAKALLEDKPE